MRLFTEEITLTNARDIGNARDGCTDAKIRTVTLEAMPDTGAWTLIINEEVRRKLGLAVMRSVKSSLADGSTREYGLTEPVEIRWKDRDISLQAMLIPNASHILLGVLPLAGMDLYVDPVNQCLAGVHGDQRLHLVNMAIINNIIEVLHRIRVELYPNYLPRVEGAYIARTANEATLTIKEVCAALKNRGGFTGSYDDLVEHVLRFFDEAAYQLCDGFAVNMGYFSVHPHVGGTFDKVTEGHNIEKHPISFRFRTRAPLRDLAEHIVVEVEGLANVSGYIDEFIDVSTEAINETLTPGGIFKISGHKLKIDGNNPEVGIYFVSAADPSQRVKVSGYLAENAASKLIGMLPALTPGAYTLEVVTQYAHGGVLLKEPRVITFAPQLTVLTS
jgi:hypothetical protein